jgi:hypothetical protein
MTGVEEVGEGNRCGGDGGRAASTTGVEAAVAAQAAGLGLAVWTRPAALAAVWMRSARATGATHATAGAAQAGTGARGGHRRRCVDERRTKRRAVAYGRGGWWWARWAGATHVQI